MEVDEKDAAAVSQDAGRTYYFCSYACKQEFDRQRSTTAADADVVRHGGVAARNADAEDVSRDTYGFPSGETPPESREERVEEANRAAEQEGVPGVKIPDRKMR
jgi:YHS domain-containing protein